MVYHLMNQTLPTVVGAGVVSRTTETMFGKGRGSRSARRGRRSASSTSSSLARTRKFDSKVYRLANTHTTKAAAERDAACFRKAGHKARVVYTGGKYVVYVR